MAKQMLLQQRQRRHRDGDSVDRVIQVVWDWPSQQSQPGRRRSSRSDEDVVANPKEEEAVEMGMPQQCENHHLYAGNEGATPSTSSASASTETRSRSGVKWRMGWKEAAGASPKVAKCLVPA